MYVCIYIYIHTYIHTSIHIIIPARRGANRHLETAHFITRARDSSHETRSAWVCRLSRRQPCWLCLAYPVRYTKSVWHTLYTCSYLTEHCTTVDPSSVHKQLYWWCQPMLCRVYLEDARRKPSVDCKRPAAFHESESLASNLLPFSLPLIYIYIYIYMIYT